VRYTRSINSTAGSPEKLLARAETAILEVADADADDDIGRNQPRLPAFKRAWRSVAAIARKVYDVVGDPLEPLSAKIGRYGGRFIAWCIGGLYRGWQEFGAVRELG